jgi:organic hydroperoxide reductase OsmC/OhrA
MLSEADLQTHAEAGKMGCPVSKAVAAVLKIRLATKLVE